MKKFRLQLAALGLCIIGLLSSTGLHAQKLIFLFGHALYAAPVDNYFKHNYNSGLGVEGGLGLGSGKTFFIATLGYTAFSSSSSNSNGQLTYVPFKIGIRHYILPGKLLFIKADAGLGYVKNYLFNTSSFSADLGVGVKLGHFEVMADYDGFTRPGAETSGYSSWIGLKAGFEFGL